MSQLLAALLLWATPALSSNLEADPLFARMSGDWIGEGRRVYAQSKRMVKLDARVRSQVVRGQLLSSNQWTETPLDDLGLPSGESRTYLREYWIRVNPEKPGFYFLAYGESLPAGAEGELLPGNAVFEVKQQIGGDQGIKVFSRTEFTAQGSVYLETAWNGDAQISESTVEYRAAPSQP